MNQVRLKTSAHNYFPEAWKLYITAFPSEERRSIDAQMKVMQLPNYHFDIIIDKGTFIGFLLWWDFETIRYVDHFATAPAQRNKGFGTLILEKFINQNEKPMLLEVELPTSPINRRRIEFYERIGCILNQHYYEIPSLGKAQDPLQLLLMSYPTPLSSIETERFVKTYHPIIFKN